MSVAHIEIVGEVIRSHYVSSSQAALSFIIIHNYTVILVQHTWICLCMAFQMTEIHHHLGVCPQFDIHYPELTAEEHLLFWRNVQAYVCCHGLYWESRHSDSWWAHHWTRPHLPTTGVGGDWEGEGGEECNTDHPCHGRSWPPLH